MSPTWGRGSGVIIPDAAAEIPVSDVRVRCVVKGRSEVWTMAELKRFAAMLAEIELDAPTSKRIAQATYQSPENHVIDADAEAKLKARFVAALDRLTPAERRIAKVALRFPGEDNTAVGRRAGVSRERVRQVMNAFRKALLGAAPEKTGPGRHRWRKTS